MLYFSFINVVGGSFTLYYTTGAKKSKCINQCKYIYLNKYIRT